LGKFPTTRARRLSSLITRSSGFVDQIFCQCAESQLFEGNANGAKFNLTNNHGWVEKTVQEHAGVLRGRRPP
jgi:hypothetical protein